MPSQKMIHRRVFDQGVLMEQPEGLNWMVDSWFNVNIAECGKLVIYRKPLVEWHQGAHESVTQGSSNHEQENELYLFRNLLWERLEKHGTLKAPSPGIVNQFTRLQRSILRLKSRQIKQGFFLLKQVRHPKAYWLFLRWILHNMTKGRISIGKRHRIEAMPL